MTLREKKYSKAFNARYMTYKEVARSFIISESFNIIIRNEHTILTGAGMRQNHTIKNASSKSFE